MSNPMPPDEDPFVRHLREAGIRPLRSKRVAGRRGGNRRRRILFGLMLLLVVGLLFLPALALRLSDWLWFREIGFERIFVTKIAAQWAIGLLAGIVAFLFLYGNARFALAGVDPDRESIHGYVGGIGGISNELRSMLERKSVRLALPWTAFLAIMAALSVTREWITALQAIHGTPFGRIDPVFGRDIGYYVFSLPAIEVALGFAFAMLIVALLLVALPIYLVRAEIGAVANRLSIRPRPQAHFALLAGVMLLVTALRIHYVRIPGLLFGDHAPLAGATYTDLQIRIPALHVLSIAALIGAALIAWAGFRGRLVRVTIRVVLVYVAIAIASGIVPSLYQRLVVQPNELARETPQIIHHIAATRAAWGIDSVESRDLAPDAALTPEIIADNRATIDNVRLWDREPLLQTFGQIQSIRTYYDFIAVDDDRYRLDGDLRQVMLSARELNTEALPTRGFINEHLTYTHGMGVTLGPSNEVTPEGLPVLFIKDLPPVSTVDLEITRPQIYFGERSNDFVLAPSGQREFDYPAGEGDAAAYSAYDGAGGVPVASFGRRLLYAFRFGSLNILLSSDLDERTRILYHRAVRERAHRALPFLLFDRDPYLVIRENGRLTWLLDAYTASGRYPYSESVGGVNYMRNSAKVAIDAYDGTVRAFITEPGDPIIRTMDAIYPGVMLPFDSMPGDLRAHIRYPEDLFRLQTSLYATYHMGNPETFYHREDQWQIPGGSTALPSGERQSTGEAFLRHMVMRLPGEPDEEFILMRPFTPRQKDNLAAWMIARNDGEEYGRLAVYKFPRQSLVFGPNQIVNRINQDTEVARQISLWDQRGSEVLRGELLVIPIGGSLIYVQPLYLRAQGGRIPELKRVVAAHEGQVAMAETLDAALAALFGEAARAGAADEAEGVPAGAATASETTRELGRRALEHYERARAAQRSEDWATYGEEMRKLGEVLREMGVE
ncbi:MAG TPA: UPF0182 family protein [Gemmatimonadales bacterium]|nr:UPF0182 family protein [Gemmatimonadales bacterium]